ncbi:MAG: 3-oxoacyl-ACP synthase III family protein [Candidatus Binatia bacterium]
MPVGPIEPIEPIEMEEEEERRVQVRSVAITAIEEELPTELVSDAALASELGLDESVVRLWSRGRERRESPDGEGPAALAARAASRMLASRGLSAADVDFIVFATNTPDMFFPGSACLLQGLLGCRTVGGLDVRSQCTGFLTALDASWRFVATGMAGRVLVVAADTPSHFNARDGRSPHLSCATADAAAAVLLEAGSGPGEILAVTVRSDGSRHRDFWCEYPASRFREGTTLPGRNRLPASKAAEGRHFPEADLDRLREIALARVPEVFAETLARAGLERVDVTLVAHLDARVEAELPALLAGAAGRVEVSDLLYGGGASLPVLASRARRAGRIAGGETAALVTAGSGASWGCGIVRVP